MKGSFENWSRATLVVLLLCPGMASAAELSQKTVAGYEAYVAKVDTRIKAQHSRDEGFLYFERSLSGTREAADEKLRRGEILIEQVKADSVPDGMIHHWRGAAFLPGVSLPRTMATVQDYGSFAQNYRPEVVSSSTLWHRGDDFQFAMRLRKHKVITVVLDTVSSVHFGQLDPDHRFSISRMTRISELADPGTPTEHLLPAGRDSGFLWRMDTYWSYVQVQGGVLVECETVSLTRDVPFGLKYLIGPFIESVPRESLEFTLRATRLAVSQRAVANK
jgi:hypothetical protein